MGRPKRLEVSSKNPRAAVKAVRKPMASKPKHSLDSLPAELQLDIVHHLRRTSLPTICQLNKHWRSVGTDELLRRLFPNPPREANEYEFSLDHDLLERAICTFIETNNADALKRLLDFRPRHPYLRLPTTYLLPAKPASLRARVTKDEEERFCLGSNWFLDSCAVDTAFKYNDMSCMKLLIDHGLADYSSLLNHAIDDNFRAGFCGRYCPSRWLARPTPGPDSRSGRNLVLNWLLAYPPRHVVQAMLVMWGRLDLHPRLRPLCDRRNRSWDNMLIVAAGQGHPASLQAIDELRMMVEILMDDTSGGVIPEARQPLTRALRIARGMASMWPGTPHLVAIYLQSICTWEDHQSRGSNGRKCNNHANNPPPLPTPPVILPPQDLVLHRLVDLKTFDEMLEPENWLELQPAWFDRRLPLWLVSTEFLSDVEAARRMRRFEWPPALLYSVSGFPEDLLHAAGAFRRWRCVEVVLDELWGGWLGDRACFNSVLCRAIHDAVHGEPGCADGRIIRKLLRTGARMNQDFKGFGDMHRDSPFRGRWFGWEPFRLAFVERQQDREQRVTPACMSMRDAILDYLSISDQNAVNFLVGEPSKALYRASTRRRRKRLAAKQERGQGAVGGSSFGESSHGSTNTSSKINRSGYP